MIVEHPFTGSALCSVDAAGRLALPAFVRQTLNRRGATDSLLIGSHEADPCLVAHEPAFAAKIHADVERRRLAEESVAPQRHHARARLAFGFVVEADIEASSVTLPPLMRRRAKIGELALLVGTGGSFEIWDAHSALETGDADLRELAAFYLDTKQAA